MKTIAIIDYRMGNVASVEKALRAIGAHTITTYQKAEIEKADALILPGVGAFGDGMRNLVSLGLINLLNQEVRYAKKPFLGICIGMQLLASKGFEFGEHDGLGWVEGSTIKLDSNDVRLPHIGWNDIKMKADDELFKNIPDNDFYFDHSFHFKPKNSSLISATCTYGEEFAAAVHQNNIYAVQFHPEKSQYSGLQVLRNFLSVC